MNSGQSLKWTILISLVLGLAAGGGCGTGTRKASQPDKIPFLPFGLDKDSDLGKIRIKLAFHSAKTGAGRQEMTLWGDGRVSLFFSRSDKDKSPKTLEGTCESARIVRLLDFMEGNGVMDGPDQVGEKPGGSTRELEIVLPDRTKRILLRDTGEYSVEQVIGAVKLAAGQCLPEALNHRLFPNL